MVSKSKLFSQLDALESELEEKFIPHLEKAAQGENDLVFCVSDFNSYTELKSKTDPLTEQMIHIGRQILTLKKKLGESSEGTLAERLCWYCREWSNSDNYLKPNVQELAKQFITEIRNQPQKNHN